MEKKDHEMFDKIFADAKKRKKKEGSKNEDNSG